MGWLGVLLHAGLGVLPYASTGLVAPPWGVAIAWALWLALAVLAIVLLRRKPALALTVPVLAVMAWVGLVTAGGRWWGWTA